MKNYKIKMITEAGIMLALATVLSFIKLYKMPQGGSVTAASMLPIVFFAMRWGTRDGIVVATLYGMIQFILEPFFLNPVQFVFDYPLAYGLLGLAGLARNKFDKVDSGKVYTIVFTIIAMVFRAISHTISGVVFFSEYAGDKNPLLYSLEYNMSYMAVEIVVTSLILYLIYDKLIKNFKRA